MHEEMDDMLELTKDFIRIVMLKEGITDEGVVPGDVQRRMIGAACMLIAALTGGRTEAGTIAKLGRMMEAAAEQVEA